MGARWTPWILFAVSSLAGCGSSGSDGDGGDADADSDADSDVDTDADTDADSDADTDTATGCGSNPACATGYDCACWEVGASSMCACGRLCETDDDCTDSGQGVCCTDRNAGICTSGACACSYCE